MYLHLVNVKIYFSISFYSNITQNVKLNLSLSLIVGNNFKIKPIAQRLNLNIRTAIYNNFHLNYYIYLL